MLTCCDCLSETFHVIGMRDTSYVPRQDIDGCKLQALITFVVRGFAITVRQRGIMAWEKGTSHLTSNRGKILMDLRRVMMMLMIMMLMMMVLMMMVDDDG